MRVYTIGHGERPLEEFIGLLQLHGITHVVDVRMHDDLFEVPEYQPDNINVALLIKGIMYANMSSSLCSDEPVPGDFRSHTTGQDYGSGLQKLMQVAMDPDRVVCILGRDPEPKKCSRMTIAEALWKKRVDVQHIEEDGLLPHWAMTGRLESNPAA